MSTRPHCRNCGSANICADAAARWDHSAGAWILADTYDSTTCEDCCYDGRALWIDPADVLQIEGTTEYGTYEADAANAPFIIHNATRRIPLDMWPCGTRAQADAFLAQLREVTP